MTVVIIPVYICFSFAENQERTYLSNVQGLPASLSEVGLKKQNYCIINYLTNLFIS